jgi:hypothetical protein
MISAGSDSDHILAQPSTLHLKGGSDGGTKSTVPKPRAYQQEMLAESLRQNIIITVIQSKLLETFQTRVDSTSCRWTLEVVKQTCRSNRATSSDEYWFIFSSTLLLLSLFLSPWSVLLSVYSFPLLQCNSSNAGRASTMLAKQGQ